MKKREVLGQEAVEFVLISALVLLSSLFVIFIFGDKIGYFFTDISAAKKAADLPSKALNPSDSSLLVTGTAAGSAVGTTAATNHPIINVPVVTNNADGSVSFSASGQNLKLDPTVLNNIDSVMQTTAGSGKTEIIKEITALLAKYQQAYPSTAVPAVQLHFGDSQFLEGGTNYNGQASTLTSTTIQVGDMFVLLQKDNSGGSCNTSNPDTCTKRRLEGNVTGINNYDGTLTYYDSGTSSYKNPITITNNNVNRTAGVINDIHASNYGGTNNMNITFNKSYNITE